MPRTRLLESVAAARCGDHYSQPRRRVSRAAARQFSAPGFAATAERRSRTAPGAVDAHRATSATGTPATAHSPGPACRTADGEPPAPTTPATNSGPAQRLPAHTARMIPAGHSTATVVGTKPRTATSSGSLPMPRPPVARHDHRPAARHLTPRRCGHRHTGARGAGQDFPIGSLSGAQPLGRHFRTLRGIGIGEGEWRTKIRTPCGIVSADSPVRARSIPPTAAFPRELRRPG